MKQKFNNCMRINAGDWKDKNRKAIVYLGKLYREYKPDLLKTVPDDECFRAMPD